jgi:dihydroxyacetone kinase
MAQKREDQERLDGRAIRGWILAFEQSIQSHRDELAHLDRKYGDGDFGMSISRAASRAVAGLRDARESPSGLFRAVSDAFTDAGGTSGPLYGAWFRGFADVAVGSASLTVLQISAAAEAGLAAVQRAGGASLGDKTMVDGMTPAVIALRSAADNSTGISEALQSAAYAARAGANATAGLLARRGRARQAGEDAKGVIDAGALL